MKKAILMLKALANLLNEEVIFSTLFNEEMAFLGCANVDLFKRNAKAIVHHTKLLQRGNYSIKAQQYIVEQTQKDPPNNHQNNPKY